MARFPPPSCIVYTSESLADAVVGAVGNEGVGKWLEPSCGTGAFLSALSRGGVPRNRITGIDIEPEAHECDDLAKVVRGVDFIEWAGSHTGEFDRVVGNPPYVKRGLVPARIDARLRELLSFDGQAVAGTANLWVGFVLRAVDVLSDGGALGLILPAAWEYADYAESLRQGVRKMFRTVKVFRSRSVLFDGVSDGSVVLIAIGKGAGPGTYERIVCGDRDELINVLRGKHHCSQDGMTVSAPVVVEDEVVLGEVLKIGIGCVTGDAKFFLLSESERLFHKLPVKTCVRVLTRTSHLTDLFMGRDEWAKLKERDERVWLFRPEGVEVANAAVTAYLQKEVSDGGCNRQSFKVRSRSVWYQPKLTPCPDVFISGQSSVGPFMCLNRLAGLHASNTLYIGCFRNLRDKRRASGWAVAMLSSHVYAQWKAAARQYPDGLFKCEPGQIAQLRVPRPKQWDGADEVLNAASRAMMSGDRAKVHRLADEWLGLWAI